MHACVSYKLTTLLLHAVLYYNNDTRAQDLNNVCNSTCRAATTSIFVDPVTGNLVVATPATASAAASTVSIAPEELPGFIGAVPCAAGDSCSAYPVAVGKVFEGVYGSGAAVSTAVSSNGRRRQLAQV
jgi:hypothetical protein